MALTNRERTEVNAGSMADIAFLLLIFFLVTTTMDVDTGIQTKLPPINNTPPGITHQRNVLTVLLNSDNELLVEDEYTDLKDLKRLALEFIDNNGDGSCTYCQGDLKSTSSDNPGKAIISLQNDRGTSYKAYVAVQNELISAYTQLRDRESQNRYGRTYIDLEKKKQQLIRALYPQIISEAEPVDLSN